MSKMSFTKAMLLVASFVLSSSASAAVANTVAYKTGEPLEKPMIMSRFVEMSSARKVENIKFADNEGNYIQLKQHKGKIAMVHLWATWCAPCIKEIPQMEDIRQRNVGKDLVVIPIAIDEESEKVAPFLERHNLGHYKTWLDPEMKIDAVLPANVVPATYFFDGSGNLIGFLRGYLDWADKDIQPFLEKLMQKYSAK